MLLGRLAVDGSYRGQGFGELLLMNALERALINSEQIAALAVIVDTKEERAVRFYQRYGFQSLGDGIERLFLPMRTIAELFSH